MLRSITLVAATTVFFVVSIAGAVEFSIVGPTSATVTAGEQFTIDVVMNNESLTEVVSLGGSVHGYDGIALFEGGEAVDGYLFAVCIPGGGCFGGLDNLAAGALFESSVGSNGNLVQIALSSTLTPVANPGAIDPGLDGNVGTTQFSLTFTAVGSGQILIGTGYEGDGVLLPDASVEQATGAIFTVNGPADPLAMVSFFDDTLLPDDWSATTTSVTGGATQQVQSLSTGGNPDDYRNMEHFIPGVASIEVFHQFNAALFLPAAQGPIEFVNYSEDRIEFDPPFSGAAVGALPALTQDGIVYQGPISNFTNTSWQNLLLTNLTAADFDDGAGGHPDFSATGGPIQFGYIRRNSSQNPSSTNTITSGIDNWSVTLFYTPAPVTLSISDETFATPDWSTVVVESTGGATQQASFIASGGNPGTYREMEHLVPGVASIEVFHAFEPTTFTPSIQGEIFEVDYAEDRIEFDPPFSGAAVGAAPALLQDGVVYAGPNATFTDTSWTSLDMPALTADDFDDGSGQHPDFSELGTEIQFGFIRRNSSQNPSSTNTIISGIDNWSFDLIYLPEPSTAAGVAVGSMLLVMLSRKRSRPAISPGHERRPG